MHSSTGLTEAVSVRPVLLCMYESDWIETGSQAAAVRSMA